MGEAYMYHWTGPALDQLYQAITYSNDDLLSVESPEQTSMKLESKRNDFHVMKCCWIRRL